MLENTGTNIPALGRHAIQWFKVKAAYKLINIKNRAWQVADTALAH